MNGEDYEQLIYSWNQKSFSGDNFSRFVFLYLAFMSCLRKKKFPHSQSDREAIDFLKNDARIEKIFFNLYYKEGRLKSSLNELISGLDLSQNMQMNNPDWQEIIESIHYVRNNLFNKGKGKDHQIVKNAGEILSPIVDILIKDMEINKKRESPEDRERRRKITREYPKAHNRWSDEEKSLLMKKYLAAKKEDKLTVSIIRNLSKSFQRPPNEIHSLLLKFGLIKY